MDLAARERLAALKAWRGEVAKEHNLPAYVIFHDATLIAIANQAPQTRGELSGISGMGAKKLEAYGEEVLRLTALSSAFCYITLSLVARSRRWSALLRECPPPLERLPLYFALQSKPAA